VGHPLDSAHEKLERADKHLVALKERVQRFENSHPYRVEMDLNAQGVEFPVRLRVVDAAPVLAWGAIIGDVVYNLRAALDHVVWALTIDGQRTYPPHPVKRPWIRTEFPIFKHEGKSTTDAGTWKNGAPDKLWGVRQDLHAVIEGLQPFRSRKHPPAEHPLWVLQELNNIDKHRAIPTLGLVVVPKGVQVRTTLEVFGMPLPPGFQDDLRLDPIEIHSGPFEDGAPLGRVKLGGTLVVPVAVLPMYMEPEASIDVLFGKGTPTEGKLARPGLIASRDCVRRIVERFEDEFRWTWP
jgi:hypothetical protein